jgi:maltose alpha-D-glucosyltransferase / alpha-amylase
MAPLAGGIEYTAQDGTVMSLAILSGFVGNCRNAWDYTLDALGRYYERVNSLPDEQRTAPLDPGHVLDGVDRELPALVEERLGAYVESARLLGARTAALHLCLGSDLDNRDFAPEPFSPFYLRSRFQSMRNHAVQTFFHLRRQLKSLPESALPDAEKVLALEKEVIARLRTVTAGRINGMRLRIHGDYRLGQVLQTGKDFLIIDFEGEPGRTVSERRIKRTPVQDVVGMLRSFDYAAHTILFKQVEHGVTQRANLARLEPWAGYWTHWTSVLFLKSYLDATRSAGFLPETGPDLKVLLDVSLLNKAIYELAHELNYRPDWVRIPLRGILQRMGT